MGKIGEYSGKIEEGILLLAAVSFFLPVKINGMAITLCVLVGITLTIKKRTFGQLKPVLWLFPLLFGLLLTGQLYTTDLDRGWTLIERNLTLLLLPIAMVGYQPFSQKQVNRLFAVFTVTGLAAGTLCLGIAAYESWQAGSIYIIPNDYHFIYNRFMHHRLTDPIGMHAVYFSLYLAVSAIWLMLGMIKRNKWRWAQLAALIYILVLIYLMKSAIIALGLAMAILLVLGIKGRQHIVSSLRNRLVFAGLGIAILGGSVFAVVNKLEHFSFQYDIRNEQMSTLAIRLSLWECAGDVIREHPVLGVGTGDADNALRQAFKEKEFTLGTKNDFNAHNMFLQYWMSNGILAVIVLLLIFLLSLFMAWRHQNFIWLSFIVLFFLFCLTESTLRTQKGLLFFIFITSFMVCHTTCKSEHESTPGS